jgi:argininosuccinate lyase
LKALLKWSASLTEQNTADALIVLETVIMLGGEFRDAYKLAADIYAAENSTKKLKSLQTIATENYFKDPSVRQHILDYINRKLLS